MRKLLATASAVAFLASALALPATVRAEVLNFDDLPTVGLFSNDLVPQAYHGFDSANLYYTTGDSFPGLGFQAGAVSSPNVAFNGGGGVAKLFAGAAFTLGSADFTQGFSPALVTVIGRTTVGGADTFSTSFTTTATPQLVAFNWSGLHEIEFQGSNFHFALDNLEVTLDGPVSAAPEPAGWGLMLMGFLGAGAMLRHRRAADRVA